MIYSSIRDNVVHLKGLNLLLALCTSHILNKTLSAYNGKRECSLPSFFEES